MIDYSKIHASVLFYEKEGFSRVEVPWTVSPATSGVTKPGDREDWTLRHNGKVLVASAEQSFIYQMTKGFLPKGSYQAITPCFRMEMFDVYHTKYFIKNELIDTKRVSSQRVREISTLAMKFFSQYFPPNMLKIVPTEGEHAEDVVFERNGRVYELGSYGIRSYEYLSWVYGTGCAEPRLTQVRKLI